ncbi:MAG: hypothetical protein AAF386_03385, partial [Pseudomonadota bacterium]
MVNIHMDLEDLRGSFERRNEGAEDERPNKAVVDAMDQVLSIGPGLTLDNVAVEKLEDRKRRWVDPGSDTQDAHQNISHKASIAEDAFGDILRNLERNVANRFLNSFLLCGS